MVKDCSEMKTGIETNTTDNVRIMEQWVAFGNINWREKPVNVTYLSACLCACARSASVCMPESLGVCMCVRVTFLIQHVMSMFHIVTSFVAPLAQLYFLLYLIHGAIFGEKVTEHKMYVLIFTTTFTRNFSHCKKKWMRYCHECENVFMQSTRYSSRILMKLEFSRQIFERSVNIKIHQIPSSGSCSMQANRRTDGHEEANSRLRNFANASNNMTYLVATDLRPIRYHSFFLT